MSDLIAVFDARFATLTEWLQQAGRHFDASETELLVAHLDAIEELADTLVNESRVARHLRPHLAEKLTSAEQRAESICLHARRLRARFGVA